MSGNSRAGVAAETYELCGVCYRSGLMPKLVQSLVFLALLSAVLCGPVLWVALRLRRAGDWTALRPLRRVWLAQTVAAALLMGGADLAGAAHLQQWLLAILLAVSLGGAAAFWAWRRARHWLAR